LVFEVLKGIAADCAHANGNGEYFGFHDS
jgi:hypothetical protein